MNKQDESSLISRYGEQKAKTDAVTHEVEQYYMGAVKAALERGDVTEARRLMLSCPDTVTAVFILIAIKDKLGKEDWKP